MIPPSRPIVMRKPSARGISGGERENSGAAAGPTFPPAHRSPKGPSLRDIVTAMDSPSKRYNFYDRISELHPRRIKLGRIERPLSAAPRKDRFGQMGAEFPDYIIERRLRRGFRPIGREVQRKRAPGARLSPLRWLKSSRMAMAREMRTPVKFHGVTNMHFPGEPGGAFPEKSPGIADAQPGDFPANSTGDFPNCPGAGIFRAMATASKKSWR